MGEQNDTNVLNLRNFDKNFQSLIGSNAESHETKAIQWGKTCEIRSFDARYDSNGDKQFTPTNAGTVDLAPDIAPGAALVVSRHYDYYGKFKRTELDVRSPYVKAALKQVVPEYADINLRTQNVVICDEPKCLFYYRYELQDYAKNVLGKGKEDKEAAKHILLALKYMSGVLRTEMYAYRNLFEANPESPHIDFESMWTIFRPGDFIYFKSGNAERVLKYSSMWRCKCPQSDCRFRMWTITGHYVSYDGKDFGMHSEHVSIDPFEDSKPVRDLPVMPLKSHPDERGVFERLVARGKRYITFQGRHHCEYDGTASMLSEERNKTSCGEQDRFPLQSTAVKGRVIVDAQTFFSERPMNQIHLQKSSIVQTLAADGSFIPLKDEQYLICDDQMPGYFLADKRWCYFKIDNIGEINYNLDAWDALVLNEQQKVMVKSLVEVHAKEKTRFDDVIQGKGRGIIFLLHGEPGVGKTLTAESVADICHRPLYNVSSGDLGVTPETVEKGLGRALRLATRWDAVILLDEADVFLQKRTGNEIERNALVAVFLRYLEYYNGIMFLTTNRIRSFDPAFKSRIHLSIKYPPLSTTSRRKLWSTFLSKIFPVDDTTLDRLAEVNVNGRQIKNVVRTAHALAESQGGVVDMSHIEMAVDVMVAFDVEVENIANGWEDDEDEEDRRGSKRQRMEE